MDGKDFHKKMKRLFRGVIAEKHFCIKIGENTYCVEINRRRARDLKMAAVVRSNNPEEVITYFKDAITRNAH